MTLSSRQLIIGSRGSQLALWQAKWIQSRLAEFGFTATIEIIKTTGDKITDVPLAKVGAKGLFTKEIEEALLDGRIDLAVHSLKDLPTVLPEGLVIAAIPERESPLDALVGSTMAGLEPGARVGTSSLRRVAQLRRWRPDLLIEPIRGNLDTRLRKLDERQFDAIVLAAAGLRRLGLGDRIAELLAPEVMCPAVGQGALAVETREDGEAFGICSRLDHAPTRAAVVAERAVLAALGGGCQVPVGAHAVLEGDVLHLRAVVIDPENGDRAEDLSSGPAGEAEQVGAAAARRLLDAGARRILVRVYGGSLPLAGKRVVVTRARRQAGALAAKLSEQGATVIGLPVIDFVAEPFPVPELMRYDWIIFTSANAVEFFFERAAPSRPDGLKVCAIGPATAGALESRGWKPDLVPPEYVAENLVEALGAQSLAAKRILLPRAAAARDVIPDELRRLGAEVDDVAVYRTVAPEDLATAAARRFEPAARPDWVTFTSSSTVKNLLAAVGKESLKGVAIASIGPITSEEVRRQGLEVHVEAEPSTIDGLVAAMVRWSREHEDAPHSARQ